MHSLFSAFILFIFLQSSITGKVIYVSDGDTFQLATVAGTKMKIRLEGVDAPEGVQEFGLEAKEFVMKEILNKMVRIEVITTDRYGRKVAKVYYDNGKDLGKELLKNGFAWHYKAYNKERELANLEEKARIERKGLWSKDNPIPPWEFRKFGRSQPVATNNKNNKAPSSGEMVLICNGSSSYAYHKKHCTGLKKCRTGIDKITIEKAREAGRKPCGYCW